jgi:hypothetical protein
VHLAESTDHAARFSDYTIARFLSVELNGQSNSRQRPLGDYQQLKAVGNAFYGVFTGNGAAFGRPFPNWEPIFVRARASADAGPPNDASHGTDNQLLRAQTAVRPVARARVEALAGFGRPLLTLTRLAVEAISGLVET